MELKTPPVLKPGDRVAVVSLSSGMLGDSSCNHSRELGIRRLAEFGLKTVYMPHSLMGSAYLAEHPEQRAEDLKAAFLDPSIQGIICAIGGDDTYRLVPFLMEDKEFRQAVQDHPKLFTGFSDTTVNHLTLYRLGLRTFYGPCFLCDLAELGPEMLPYTRQAFQRYFSCYQTWEVSPSPLWYEERKDFSPASLGKERAAHREERGYELLQGDPVFTGELMGGCLESIYDLLTGSRYGDEAEICRRYQLFPQGEAWRGKVLFLETCEEKPAPALLIKELEAIANTGAFRFASGVLVGKPMDEAYYDAYKEVYRRILKPWGLPVLYNLNFGHAYPRMALPYGAVVRADAVRQELTFPA